MGELHHLTKIFKFSIYILSCFHVIIGIFIVHCGKLWWRILKVGQYDLLVTYIVPKYVVTEFFLTLVMWPILKVEMTICLNWFIICLSMFWIREICHIALFFKFYLTALFSLKKADVFKNIFFFQMQKNVVITYIYFY